MTTARKRGQTRAAARAALTKAEALKGSASGGAADISRRTEQDALKAAYRQKQIAKMAAIREKQKVKQEKETQP